MAQQQRVQRIPRETVLPLPPAGEESPVLERAVHIIGSRREALRWMGTPVRILGYSTPISLLHTAKGRKSVLAALDKLQHGVL
jgi:putative toxin-antitoxin system antitoxin component (TIGR02293 family)